MVQRSLVNLFTMQEHIEINRSELIKQMQRSNVKERTTIAGTKGVVELRLSMMHLNFHENLYS